MKTVYYIIIKMFNWIFGFCESGFLYDIRPDTTEFSSGANFRENYVNIQMAKIKEMKPVCNGRGKFFDSILIKNSLLYYN